MVAVIPGYRFGGEMRNEVVAFAWFAGGLRKCAGNDPSNDLGTAMFLRRTPTGIITGNLDRDELAPISKPAFSSRYWLSDCSARRTVWLPLVLQTSVASFAILAGGGAMPVLLTAPGLK